MPRRDPKFNGGSSNGPEANGKARTNRLPCNREQHVGPAALEGAAATELWEIRSGSETSIIARKAATVTSPVPCIRTTAWPAISPGGQHDSANADRELCTWAETRFYPVQCLPFDVDRGARHGRLCRRL